MTALSDEIAAYERMKNGLETDHFGRWALVHREELIGTYESFESAADDAVRKFGGGAVPDSPDWSSRPFASRFRAVSSCSCVRSNAALRRGRKGTEPTF